MPLWLVVAASCLNTITTRSLTESKSIKHVLLVLEASSVASDGAGTHNIARLPPRYNNRNINKAFGIRDTAVGIGRRKLGDLDGAIVSLGRETIPCISIHGRQVNIIWKLGIGELRGGVGLHGLAAALEREASIVDEAGPFDSIASLFIAGDFDENIVVCTSDCFEDKSLGLKGRVSMNANIIVIEFQ